MVVGGGTCIGANSFVSHSVIGRNCRIGRCAQFYDACLSVITLLFKEKKNRMVSVYCIESRIFLTISREKNTLTI